MSNTTEPSFREELRKNKRVLNNFGLILLLIFLLPIGLYVMFKKSGWSKKSKTIVVGIVSAFVALVVVGMIFAPPTVTLDNLKENENKSVNDENFIVVGSVFPYDASIIINDKAVETDKQGKFNYSVPLNEGDNDIKIIVKKDDKQSTYTYKLHKYTKAEMTAQEEATAKKEAEAADAAAKKKADDAAAAQTKQQQEADAKAKVDADAAAKTAEDKAAADAAAKAKADADAAAAVTVSQKNALSKAKSYLSYTAFSHDGLVDQLVYDQFSTTDATYGADNAGADWNEQAAKKAKSYMSYSSFSRGGLIDQLEYDKFTPGQAAYGTNAVGL